MSGNKATKNCLRVMSYNILAPSLVGETDYGNIDPAYLKWENRFPQIKKEIDAIKPHILCL
jgi:mRNA deadenylase 3'-5' endonuclease subunit Ccr4